MADIKAEREAIRAEQTAAQQEYDYWKNVKTLLNRQDVNTTEQIAEEQSADANLSVAENETLQPGQTVEETTAAKQEKQPQYPVDEAGEPLWYEMTDGQFDVAIAELGDTADAFIADKIKEAKKATEKAEKAKPKSTEFAKRKAEQQAITAEKAAAQKAYDYWTAQQARRIGASQKKAPQVTQQVGENITGKYQTSNRTYGNTDTYILPNGEKINGRYVIVEADAITPSHDVNNGYQKSEGFPTDENGNTINDRDYQADKSAQTIVEQNAANYDARAIQTPVIVTNQGIVLSGNGRTMSGQIAASQGTDTEYLSYLKDHAGRYGFTAEQISGYQHPRLVLEVSDNVPLNAETFAKFNAEDKKTISPTEKAVKAGKTVTDITLEKIAALLDDKETLSDVYADETATAQIIKILQSDGVININEVAELMDGKKLSAQGKDFLETLLVGKILNEQSVRLVAQMRNIRATVIKSIMPLLNNSRLRKGQNGENYSLSDELNKAIEFIYAADRANMPITDYISQTNLFDTNPADIYDAATQIIAVALTKGQNNFKQFVNKYNTAAEHAASGQIDIFAGRIKTKKEILNELIEEYGNTGQAAADTQSRLGNSKVKSGIQSVRGDDAGNRGADTGGRGTEQGTERVTTTADTSQTAAAGQTTETPGGRIEDYGEQIAGARKDILRDLARTVENTTLQSLISLPFSKAFKRPDLKKALESGALREKDVYFAEAVMTATLSRKKPKAGTRKDRIAKLETGKTGVESWAEEAFSGIQILKELFNAEETERDAIIKRTLSVRTYGEEQVKAHQQKLEQWNPGKTFNGTAYPINQIALFYEVLRQINLRDRYDISFPVVAAVPDITNDYYYLITPNGEKLYYLQNAKTFDNVVSQITYLTKLYNDIEVSEHPRETFHYIGREPIYITNGWIVFEYANPRSLTPKRLTFDTKEQAEAYREKINKENNKKHVSKPVEDKAHNGYKRYEAVFTNPITGEHLGLGIEYDSKESAEASLKDDYQKLNEAANEAIAQKNAETKDNKKELLEIIKYYDYENKKFKYGIIISDSASKNNPFDTMPLYFAEGIETKEEALSLLEKNKDDWEKKAKEVKERRQKFVYFDGDGHTRIGEDYRQGKNVSAEEFATKFGFRGVQFGNWTNQEDRQAALNNAYDSFMDLSRILNVSPRALSLNGELGIAFGSRGSGNANAHYETKEVVINLTKTRGAGSLAHEWWHALDNYFARQSDIPAGFTTADKNIKLRSEMRDAFDAIVDNIKKSDYHSRSRKRGTYWGSIEEETARLFGEWIVKQLSQHNAYNHFLSEGTGDAQERYARMQYEIYQVINTEFNLHKGKERKELMTYEEFKKTPQALRGFVYPTKEELETFGKDLDNLFDVIQERVDEETGNIALYRTKDTEERYRESEEPVSRQKQTGIPYRLSGELDENGHPFVLASDGTTTFGEIRADSGLQPAPIKLSRGIQDENGKGYGLLHIEANHGEEIRKAGFSSVNDFVSFIAHNYDKDNIRVGKRRHNGNITYLLQVTDSHDNTLFIEMSRDGSYWNVNSAGVFRKKYSNKKETVVKTEPQQPNNAISAGSSLSENEERGITSSEPNGEPPVSNSKYSKESSNVQEPLRHRTGEEAESRDIIDMTEEELAEIRAKEREKIDRIFGKDFLDNVAKAVEKRKAERKAVVSKAARELRSELATSPDIVLVSDLKDIPEEDLQGKTPQEVIRRMRAKGWYTPGNGKVYINLSMHSTAEDVKATILHEVVAHKGLRALLGEESFGALCDAVYRSMPKKRQKAYEDTYKNIYPNAAEAELHRIIADEYMARLAEGGVRQSIPQRIISAIREFLRSIGIDLDINDADIRHLLAQSYKNMQEADAVKVLDNSALLARLRKAAEETHIKSEAESLYRLGDNNKTFSERVNRAVENKGTVMPNLAEENLKVINIPKHKYKGSVVEAIKQAEEDARKKYQGKTLYYDNYGTAFDYTISGESIEKSISKKATDKSTNIGIHIAVLNRLDEVIANSIEVEEHPDYKKGADEERRPENGYNANTLIHRFYGAIKIDGIVYRVKTTMKESRSAVEGNKQYSYEVTNVERLNADALSRSNDLGGLTSSREDALPLAKIIEKETKSYEKGKKILEASRESDIRFRIDNDLEAEEQAIIERAKANGTYMKAPNGEPTKLTPKQWVQVRTKAFKEWFGDWEKAAKYRMINDIEPTVIKNILDSKAEAFKFYGNIRDVINKTDGRKVRFFNTAFDKVYRDGGLFAKSITGLKECFENSICAYSEKDNRGGVQRWGGSVHKTHPNIDFYHNYIGKVSIHEKECFVRFTVQEEKSGGNGVHSFFVSEVELYEKGQDTQTRLPLTRQKNGQPALTDAKLQKFLEEAKDAAENASKVVDENGEPRVIDGLYLNIKERNPITRLDISINKANNYVNKISEIENETGMEWDNESIFYQEEKAYNLLESIVSQKDYIEILINSIRKGIIPSIVVAYRYGDINERERSYNYRDQIFEQGISVVGRASELNTNIDKYYELFYGEQPYNIVVGVYSGNRGADGEILLTPATKLGLVENLGNIIKSATDNTGSFSSENADIRFRMDNDLEAINKRFNEELERYQHGKMSKNEMFHLGLPNGIMSIFLPNLPIVMRQKVVNKAAKKKHDVEVSSIMNMPQKISEPIFIFKKDNKSLSILSEMKDRVGRNVFVALDLLSEIQDGKRYIEVNNVTTVHGRRMENIIRPINENNSLQWVDKKKALEWFSSASPNVQQEITSQELKDATNKIKTFENPNFETEKNTEDIRFRLDTPEEQQVSIASEASYKRYEQIDKAPEIDYDMPAGDVAEQVSAKAAIEPLYRLDVFDKDFASEIAIQEAMQQCVSINSNNPPFTVNMADIYGMYRVLLCMSIK